MLTREEILSIGSGTCVLWLGELDEPGSEPFDMPHRLYVVRTRVSEGNEWRFDLLQTDGGMTIVEQSEIELDRFPYSLQPGAKVVWTDPDESAEQPRKTILLDGIRAQSYDDDAVVSISGRDADGGAEVAFECLWGELEPE